MPNQGVDRALSSALRSGNEREEEVDEREGGLRRHRQSERIVLVEDDFDPHVPE